MSKDPYVQFLEDLRKKRLARKMTQAQVAAKLKISRAQYTALERGRSQLHWRHLHGLARALNTTITIRAA